MISEFMSRRNNNATSFYVVMEMVKNAPTFSGLLFGFRKLIKASVTSWLMVSDIWPSHLFYSLETQKDDY